MASSRTQEGTVASSAARSLQDLASKSGMHLFTRWFKPNLYNQGAAPSFADGSAKIRIERVQSAASVIQAHNLFGLRADIQRSIQDEPFRKSFGQRLRAMLNTADKVAFFFNNDCSTFVQTRN